MSKLIINGNLKHLETRPIVVPVATSTVNAMQEICVSSASQRITLAVLVELGLQYVRERPEEFFLFDTKSIKK